MNQRTKLAVSKIVKQFTGQLIALLSDHNPRAKDKPAKASASTRGATKHRNGKIKRTAHRAKSKATKQERGRERRMHAKGKPGQHHRDRAEMQSLRFRALEIVSKNSGEAGISMGEIAALMRVEPGDVSFPMDSLRSKGLVTMVGLRSKARWFVTEAGRRITRVELNEMFAPPAPKPRRPSSAAEADSTPAPPAAPAVESAAATPPARDEASAPDSSPPAPTLEHGESAE